MLAAILNISIPLELGRVVNTIAFSEENRGENWDEVGDYLRRMMLSGVRLGGMYLTQVRSVCESDTCMLGCEEVCMRVWRVWGLCVRVDVHRLEVRQCV